MDKFKAIPLPPTAMKGRKGRFSIQISVNKADYDAITEAAAKARTSRSRFVTQAAMYAIANS